MAWENRKSRGYYYRKVRTGERVRSVYLGNSPTAHALATADATQRTHQAQAWAAEKALRRSEHCLAHLVDDFAAHVGHLLTAHLLLAGCHTHRRQWRAPRVPPGSAPVEPCPEPVEG